MKQQQTYMTSGITTMIATGGEIGDVVARCLQAHNDGIWDYFDEEIQDVLDGMQMMRTKEKASRQDPDDISQMELDFDKYLQGIESGDVIELDRDED